MKLILTVIALVSTGVYAQNVGIGTKNPKSKLHVAGEIRIDSLSNNSDSGIVLYNKLGVLKALKFTGRQGDVLRGDGSFTSLNAVAAASSSWLTLGNSGNNPAINFLGTTDAQALKFRVNNIKAGEINPKTGNVSFGLNSLAANTTGYSNVALGTRALFRNTFLSNQVAIGDSSLFSMTTAEPEYLDGFQPNVAVGSKALYSNTATGNTAVGTLALMWNTTGNMNTAVGLQALVLNDVGYWNCAFGKNALFNNKTGGENTAVGMQALEANADGGGNSAVGSFALYMVEGSGNTAIGAGTMTGGSGWRVGQPVLTGSNNTALGVYALAGHQSTSLGISNVAVGVQALFTNDGGYSNIAIGSSSLASNIKGHHLLAVGDSALYNQIDNTSGLYANTAIGSSSMLRNKTGYRNTALGYQSSYLNTTGFNNTASGYQSLRATTTGASNTGAGFQTLLKNTSGIANTAVGSSALGSNITGRYNTGIGVGADVTLSTLTNSTAIGYNAKVNASNKVRIGNAAVTVIEGQVPFTSPSDGRYKFNVQENVMGLNFILRLRPVTYQFDARRFDEATRDMDGNNIIQASYEAAESIRRTGFIAQEVEQAADLSGYNFSGIIKPISEKEHYSLSYESFVVPLVKAMQEQHLLITQLQDQIRLQQKQIDVLVEAVNKK